MLYLALTINDAYNLINHIQHIPCRCLFTQYVDLKHSWTPNNTSFDYQIPDGTKMGHVRNGIKSEIFLTTIDPAN